MIGAILLIQVFTHGSVTWARVQGAIAVYLMFGFGWAHAYAIAMHFNPHAFTSSVGMLTSVADWTYFSFATLTTLGYGDIVPSGPLSRMLAVSEALTGQLYLTVLIARLVALQVTSAQEGTSRGS
jgi:voltage-gated potassium channel Kch